MRPEVDLPIKSSDLQAKLYIQEVFRSSNNKNTKKTPTEK